LQIVFEFFLFLGRLLFYNFFICRIVDWASKIVLKWLLWLWVFPFIVDWSIEVIYEYLFWGRRRWNFLHKRSEDKCQEYNEKCYSDAPCCAKEDRSVKPDEALIVL
jgi:hypothetical protein